jgi:hypothetical protein
MGMQKNGTACVKNNREVMRDYSARSVFDNQEPALRDLASRCEPIGSQEVHPLAASNLDPLVWFSGASLMIAATEVAAIEISLDSWDWELKKLLRVDLVRVYPGTGSLQDAGQLIVRGQLLNLTQKPNSRNTRQFISLRDLAQKPTFQRVLVDDKLGFVLWRAQVLQSVRRLFPARSVSETALLMN